MWVDNHNHKNWHLNMKNNPEIFFPIIMICIFLVVIRMISIIIFMHVFIIEVIFPIMTKHDKFQSKIDKQRIKISI